MSLRFFDIIHIFADAMFKKIILKNSENSVDKV